MLFKVLSFILGGALLSAFLVLAAPVFAYDQNNTHPALTDEIADFHNLSFPDQKLSYQEKQWLVQGSINEDDGVRMLYHFYDPVHNRGLAMVAGASSKDWGLAANFQMNVLGRQYAGFTSVFNDSSEADFSYGRALEDYAKGNRERAFVAFGHILHLLEDAGVPDHSRDDTHPPILDLGSPYEHEMAKWNPDNFQIARTLFLRREKPVSLSSMGSYFDRVANYSNNNFFSKDTISNEKYSKPLIGSIKKLKIDSGENYFIVGIDSRTNKEFPLAFVDIKFGSLGLEISKFVVTHEQIGSYILDGYWERLSKEVVINGAGALKLFLEEAEEARREYLAKTEQKKPSFWAQMLGVFGFGSDLLTTPDVGTTSGVKDGTSDVKDTELSTRPTFDGSNPQGGDTDDTRGDRKMSPTVSPMLPMVSPLPLVSPFMSPVSTSSPQASPTPKLTTSDGQKISDVKTTGRVVINEIAWAGTMASANDEWIELYNTENFDINLAGWTLKAEDGTPEIIISGLTTPDGGTTSGVNNSVIKAQGYFLLERTDDSTVNTVTADQIYSGALGNEGEVLRLVNSAGTLIDTAGKADEKWLFGNSVGKVSMERTPDGGWKNFTGNPSAKDANGNFINGTPGTANSTAVVTFSSGGGGGGGGGSTSSPSPSPTPTPTPTPSPSPTPSPEPTPEKININTADKTSLMSLPGIGEVKSQAIIDYRTTNGPFSQIEDIQNVSGIGPVTFENIKDLITVGDVVSKPSAVTDLATVHHSPTITATWSAPDSGSFNAASLSYDLRYSADDFSDDDSIWDDATVIASSSLPNVGTKGASQNASFDISYEYGQTVYFALKTRPLSCGTDSCDGESELSNIGEVSFPAAIDDDSWAMLGKDQYHTSFADVAGPAGPSPTVSEFPVDPEDPLSEFDNVFRSDQISAPCDNGGDNVRIYDHNQNSVGAFPCAGGGGTWIGYFNNSYNDTIFTQFEQVGTLPCGTYEECKNKETTLSIRQVVLRADGWTPLPTWSVGQPVADADGNIYFGTTDGLSYKLLKLNKNGVKQWEYPTNVSIGTPAVLSDGTVYFGRSGAGGVLAFTALKSDGSKKWDYDDASTVKSIAVSPAGEPHFTFTSGTDKLAVLNTDGSLKTTISGSGLNGFTPVVLDDGTIITAKYVSGNQFFNGYSADGSQFWPAELFYTGTNGNTPTNPSYDQSSGKTYSAAGPKLFSISSDGSTLNSKDIAPWDYSATTTVAITSDTLFVGFSNLTNPASGSKLFSIKKSDLTVNWSFSADSKINQQMAIDKDANVYFSTQNGKLYSIDSTGSQRWVIDFGSNSDISPVLTKHGLIWSYGNKVVGVN